MWTKANNKTWFVTVRKNAEAQKQPKKQKASQPTTPKKFQTSVLCPRNASLAVKRGGACPGWTVPSCRRWTKSVATKACSQPTVKLREQQPRKTEHPGPKASCSGLRVFGCSGHTGEKTMPCFRLRRETLEPHDSEPQALLGLGFRLNPKL